MLACIQTKVCFTPVTCSERPIAFGLRTVSAAGLNYSQSDEEAVAVVFVVKKFHQYLYGCEFEIFRDHKPSVVLLGKDKEISQMSSPCMQH